MLQSFIGSGIVEIAPYDAAVDLYSRSFRDTGNNSAFSYGFTVNDRTLASFRSPSGGTYASAPRIDTVTGQIAMRNLNPDNLALALWGTTASAAATAIADEAHVIHAGKFIPTNRMIDTTVAPVVEKGATVISTSDYTVSEHGITIAATITTATVVDGDAITISYTPKASISVQALVTAAPSVSVFLRGFDAVSGQPHSSTPPTRSKTSAKTSARCPCHSPPRKTPRSPEPASRNTCCSSSSPPDHGCS